MPSSPGWHSQLPRLADSCVSLIYSPNGAFLGLPIVRCLIPTFVALSPRSFLPQLDCSFLGLSSISLLLIPFILGRSFLCRSLGRTFLVCSESHFPHLLSVAPSSSAPSCTCLVCSRSPLPRLPPARSLLPLISIAPSSLLHRSFRKSLMHSFVVSSSTSIAPASLSPVPSPSKTVLDALDQCPLLPVQAKRAQGSRTPSMRGPVDPRSYL